MQKRHRCACQNGPESQEFDARGAYLHLQQKYEQLAALMARYLSESAQNPAGAAAMASSIADNLTTIVGGVPVAATDFPECCLVGRRRANGTISWFCTGVLVHKRVVLSAAHCFDPQAPANVVALKANNISNLSAANVVNVRRMIINPLYPQTQRFHDAAVLILRSDAQVAPVGIASTAEIAAASETTLVGFGNSDRFASSGFGRKRMVAVPITHVRRTAAEDFEDAEDVMGFDADLEFVAGGGGFDTCTGDSGGPAYITVGGQRKVAGLTSRATDNAVTPCGDAGIYTRVDANLAFIQSTAASFGITIP